jgi:predicted ABC-type ATPase
VFAGPNGSGKSTSTAGMNVVGAYINADDIKAQIGCSDLQAAEEAERLREYFLAKKKDFTFETVLSTDRNLVFLRRAKQAGYIIRCIFVLTVSPELNRLRVKSRVLAGGHDVSPEKIRSRYAKSLANLPELIQICDVCTVFDNSTDMPTVIYHKDDFGEVISASPLWSRNKIIELVQHVKTMQTS